MNNFIKAIYADLIHRVDLVIVDINNINHHADIKDRFINQTVAKLSSIKNELQNSLNTGVLNFDVFSSNNLFKFNAAHREFKEIHSYRYLPIKNYNSPEIFFFRLINKIYSEHRIAANPPIVSTISNHDYYYWAVPYYEIIALPSGEENSLLNLPDIYHEIGHLLNSMFKNMCYDLTSKVIDEHFSKEIVRVIDEGLGQYYGKHLEIAKHLWQDSWLEEFSCDLVGTYMTGVAYAWTNLKLLTTGHGSVKIYQYSKLHPADEARMRIIILMLEKLGLSEDKQKIDTAWSKFLKDTIGFKPNYYSLLYPDKLLMYLVDEIFNFYQNADLASYPELLNNDVHSVAQILNEAWYNAQKNPETYFEYEKNIIDSLNDEFGLSSNI